MLERNIWVIQRFPYFSFYYSQVIFSVKSCHFGGNDVLFMKQQQNTKVNHTIFGKFSLWKSGLFDDRSLVFFLPKYFFYVTIVRVVEQRKYNQTTQAIRWNVIKWPSHLDILFSTDWAVCRYWIHKTDSLFFAYKRFLILLQRPPSIFFLQHDFFVSFYLLLLFTFEWWIEYKNPPLQLQR